MKKIVVLISLVVFLMSSVVTVSAESNVRRPKPHKKGMSMNKSKKYKSATYAKRIKNSTSCTGGKCLAQQK